MSRCAGVNQELHESEANHPSPPSPPFLSSLSSLPFLPLSFCPSLPPSLQADSVIQSLDDFLYQSLEEGDVTMDTAQQLLDKYQPLVKDLKNIYLKQDSKFVSNFVCRCKLK